MIKSIDVFFFKAITSALEVNFCFSLWSNLIQSRPFVCSAPKKSFVSSFLRSLLITYLITLSLENVLDFGSKNLYESCQIDCLKSTCLFKFRRILIPAWTFFKFHTFHCFLLAMLRRTLLPDRRMRCTNVGDK